MAGTTVIMSKLLIGYDVIKKTAMGFIYTKVGINPVLTLKGG